MSSLKVKDIKNINGKWLKHYDSNHKYELFEIDNIIANKYSSKQLIQILNLKECGKTLLLDGHFQITDSTNKPYHELLVIISAAFLQKDKPDFLIMGGGDGVALAHLFKLNPSINVELVEYDKEVLELSKVHLKEWNNEILESNFGNIIVKDAIEYLKNSSGIEYDTIIGDITPPHSGCNSKFWSKEFLKLLKSRLNNNGNIVLLGEHSDIKSSLNTEFIKLAQDEFKCTMPLINVYTGSCIFYLTDKEVDIKSFTNEILKIKPISFNTISIESIKSAIYSGMVLVDKLSFS